jgi:hypothetical protein
MGSPLSPIIANLYMEDFEERAINTAPHKLNHWMRYVDDTYFIWTHGRENLDIFLRHMNSQSNFIKFTMEIENDKKLPFLDILLSKNTMNPSLIKSTGKRLTLTGTYKLILTTILLRRWVL